ncbi:MAG TPA: hypothetical protein VF039_05555 [Longimicrobiales bacterium]
MSAVRQLRETLELRFPEAMPIARGLAPAVATGVRELDAALPNGGLPRGCLTVWRGGAAASALLRSACVQAVARGERAAWVDGAGVTVGDFWPRGVMMVRPRRSQAQVQAGAPAGRGHGRGRWLNNSSGSLNRLDTPVRPSSALPALAAAEELLRSGGFALVVVTGVPGGLEAELVRLSRVAREGGGAVVTVEQPCVDGRPGGAVSAARLRVETWYRPEAHAWRRGVFGEPVELATMGVGARVTGTGWLRHVNLELPVLEHAYRLSLDPGLVDRRGVKPVPRRSEHLVEHGVEAGRDAVQSTGGGGFAGAGAAGGRDAGGGAAAADRGAGAGVGGRAWAGRASVRRGAERVPVGGGVG